MMKRIPALSMVLVCLAVVTGVQADHVRDLQEQAVKQNRAEFGHWGWRRDRYMHWGTHSNRLIPVYTFGTKNAGRGIELPSYTHGNSPYASEQELFRLYGYVPDGTLHSSPPYLDQTNICNLQRAALKAGKKHIILVVFDGMDWYTTWAACIYKTRSIPYREGRGTGLFFQDYTAGGTTEYAWMVTSAYAMDADVDVNTQTVNSVDLKIRGGYAWQVAGLTPWSSPTDLTYLVRKPEHPETPVHAYTDSSSSASSMTAGLKTYNASVNVDVQGRQVDTIAHEAQRAGYRIGVVTSVPIPHATPACTYAHNVDRDDYQDITRDLLGLPSVSHPRDPLPGVDVLMGGGWGENRSKDSGAQGENFVPGNPYLTQEDLQKADLRFGGKYVVAQREANVDGREQLWTKTQEAIDGDHRLLAFFGVGLGHLPFRTADGNYNPVIGRKKILEKYSPEDLRENPTLADMATAALTALHRDDKPFWLMVESGDVDWGNHDNNIDCSIGAVISGDMAVRAIAEWVEKNSSWEETVMIVTADHGHYLVLDRPELLIPPAEEAGGESAESTADSR